MNFTSTRSIVVLISIGAAVFSLLVLSLGWFGGNERLIRYSPDFQAMVPSTAFSFFLLTVALTGVGYGRNSGRRAAIICVWLTASLVAVNLAARIFVHPDGLDTLLPVWSDAGDRMSFLTAALMLLATFLIFLTAKRMSDPPLALMGGALTGLTTTGSIAMLHGLDINSPYRLSFCDGISLYTLLLFGLVFAGLLLLQLGHHYTAESNDTLT